MLTEKKKQRTVQKIERWGDIFNALLRSTKPIISAVALLFYNVTLTVMLFMGKLETSDYIAAVGPLSMAVIGFWFAGKKDSSTEESQSIEEKNESDS